MPQALIIQTESIVSTSSKHAPKAKASADSEAFSAQLDKQVKQADLSRPKLDKGQAANTAESDKEIAADGNNLPAETSAENASTETTTKDTETSTAESGDAESNETGASEQSELVEEALEESLPAVDVTDDATLNTVTSPVQKEGSTQTPISSDKPIRARVSVSQQAVDHAKAAPVEMTAKAHPKQSAEANADELNDEVVADNQKTISRALRTEAAISTLGNKPAEVTLSEKPATPNLAAALKQEAADDSKAPKIRADILEALQRQQPKQEVGVNLRNQIASQPSAKVDTAPATLPSMLAESNSSSLTTLVAGSVLTSSGQSSAPANPLSPTVLSLPIQPGMQNPAWTQVMSSRVVWMAKEGLQQAQLRMNPANLGPVEVKLHVQNDQASVTFLAQHSATRDALEQALPRLRESFAENGMELTNAQVGEQQQQHREQSEQTSESLIFTQAAGQEDDIETEAVETVSSEQTTGLSLYA
jgi:flagellar hook-length control protein FliK